MDFFKCLICAKYFPDLWKVQVHIKQHENDEEFKKKFSGTLGKRGMLPIEKVTFKECHVPIVRNRIDPKFLEEFEMVEATPVKRGPGRPRGVRRKTEVVEKEKVQVLSSENVELPRRSIRKSRLQANSNLKKVTATLNLSDNDDCDQDEVSSDGDFNSKSSGVKKRRRRKVRNKLIDKSYPDKIGNIPCPISFCVQKVLDYQALLSHLTKHSNAERKETLHLSENCHNLQKYSKDYYFNRIFFHCKLCLKKFASFKDVQSHSNSAHSEDNIKCKYCSTNFQRNVEMLVGHLKEFHGNELYPVEERKPRKKSRGKQSPNLANNEEYQKRPFPCPACPKRFKYTDNLRRHFYKHLENNPFTCDFPNCSRKLSSAHDLRRHKQGHLKREQRKNSSWRKLSSYGFRLPNLGGGESRSKLETEDNLSGDAVPIVETKLEVKYENGEAIHIEAMKPNKISELSPSTDNQKSLDVLLSHRDITTDPAFQIIVQQNPSALQLLSKRKYKLQTTPLFKCSECKRDFNRAYSLQLHLKAFHKKTIVDEVISKTGNGEQVQLMCGACAYPAKNKDDLKSHMEGHDIAGKWKRIFKCSEENCTVSVNSEKKLHLHIQRIHQTEGKYPCNLCDRKFHTGPGLGGHEIRAHNITKPTKSYSEQKRQCNVCNLKIVKSRFRSHIRDHVNNQKPLCMLCNDTFATKAVLQRHISAVHMGLPVNKNFNDKRRKRKAMLRTQGNQVKDNTKRLLTLPTGNEEKADDIYSSSHFGNITFNFKSFFGILYKLLFYYNI